MSVDDKQSKIKQKIITYTLTGLVLTVIVFVVYMYNEGGRGLECEDAFKKWQQEVNQNGGFTFDTMEQFHELLNSGFCMGMVDREKTLELNPELKIVYEDWLQSKGMK